MLTKEITISYWNFLTYVFNFPQAEAQSSGIAYKF